MNREEFRRRIMLGFFFRGIPAVVVFATIWYFGGYHVWAHFLSSCFKLLPFSLSYQPGSTEAAVFLHKVVMEGRQVELNFLVNQLNVVLGIVILLLGTFPHENWLTFLRRTVLCLGSVVVYQAFSIFIQLYIEEIGPNLANQLQAFWEETAWYRTMKKIAEFDKLILRFWAWGPTFICALVVDYFVAGLWGKKKVAAKKKG